MLAVLSGPVAFLHLYYCYTLFPCFHYKLTAEVLLFVYTEQTAITK